MHFFKPTNKVIIQPTISVSSFVVCIHRRQHVKLMLFRQIIKNQTPLKTTLNKKKELKPKIKSDATEKDSATTQKRNEKKKKN